MASITSPTVSNSSVLNGTPSEHSPSHRGRLRFQASTKKMANTPRITSTPQLASARYVRQFWALLEHQREVFEEERALWHIERSDLQDQISHLEASLRQAQKGTSSQATSPTSRNGSASSFSSISTASISRHASTGDEFWRGAGGRGDTRPSRTFSPTSEQSSGSTQRLASISENGSSSLSDTIHRASIPEVDKTGSFDGITFRKSSRAPSTSMNGTTRHSPSPSPSPSHVSPGTLSLPVSGLAPPNTYVTEHAGHTPLARGSIDGTDGTSSDISSATATPTEPKKERPPYEPHASFAKPPSERSDSYFAGALPEPAEDPAMSEPLGLGDGNASEAQDFLNQVDSKLKEAVRQEQTGPKPQGVGNTPESNALSDPPEHEPPLRIKRSMNFGSQLGGSKRV